MAGITDLRFRASVRIFFSSLAQFLKIGTRKLAHCWAVILYSSRNTSRPMNSNPEQAGAMPPKQYASLYADTEDESSPPPDNGVPIRAPAKTRSKTPSNNATKRKRTPKTLNDESEVQTPAFLKGPVVDGFAALEQAEAEAKAKATPVGKPSRSRARTRMRPSSGFASEYDSQDNRIMDGAANYSASPQDGRRDPNMSGIFPPLPSNLVKPDFQGFETGYHVVTAGTEVGISVYKGIADSRLNCDKPSTFTFNTWEKAQAYYKICFEAGSVHIREPLVTQTPTFSPVRKKTKVQAPTSRLPGARAPRQPNFAPATKTNKPNNPSTSSTHETQGSTGDSIAEYAAIINRRSHHGVQATALSPQPIQSAPNDPRPDDLTTPTPSPQIFRPCVVFVDSSDESDTTSVAANLDSASKLNHSNAAGLPIPSSSLIVQFSSPPATHREDSPVIIISDDEDEDLGISDPATDQELRRLMIMQKSARPLPRGSHSV